MTVTKNTLVRNLKTLETDMVIDRSVFERVGYVNQARQADNGVKDAFDRMVDAIDNDLAFVRGLLDDAECDRLNYVFEFGILVDD